MVSTTLLRYTAPNARYTLVYDEDASGRKSKPTKIGILRAATLVELAGALFVLHIWLSWVGEMIRLPDDVYPCE